MSTARFMRWLASQEEVNTTFLLFALEEATQEERDAFFWGDLFKDAERRSNGRVINLEMYWPIASVRRYLPPCGFWAYENLPLPALAWIGHVSSQTWNFVYDWYAERLARSSKGGANRIWTGRPFVTSPHTHAQLDRYVAHHGTPHAVECLDVVTPGQHFVWVSRRVSGRAPSTYTVLTTRLMAVYRAQNKKKPPFLVLRRRDPDDQFLLSSPSDQEFIDRAKAERVRQKAAYALCCEAYETQQQEAMQACLRNNQARLLDALYRSDYE